MNTIQKSKDYKISGTNTVVVEPYLGPIRMLPFRINRLYDVYTIIEVATGAEVKKFNSLEKAEAYMYKYLIED